MTRPHRAPELRGARLGPTRGTPELMAQNVHPFRDQWSVDTSHAATGCQHSLEPSRRFKKASLGEPCSYLGLHHPVPLASTDRLRNNRTHSSSMFRRSAYSTMDRNSASNASLRIEMSGMRRRSSGSSKHQTGRSSPPPGS